MNIQDLITFPFGNNWHLADSSVDQFHIENLENEKISIEIRIMSVDAKNADHMQQMLSAALMSPEPEKISDNLYWAKDEAASESDEEAQMHRWLVAINQNNSTLKLVIVDLICEDIDANIEQQVGEVQEGILSATV